ncbi:MAG: hypothetical protein ABSE77_13155 [Acidimicrobiales bacterium]
MALRAGANSQWRPHLRCQAFAQSWDLASPLVRAGAVRALELDINPYWTVLASYPPSSPTGMASPQNGRDLLPEMVGAPGRFFGPSWDRDFITVSARSA